MAAPSRSPSSSTSSPTPPGSALETVRQAPHGRILLDALAAGVLAALLALPILGFRLIEVTGGLALDYRFRLVGLAALGVFAGRILVLEARLALAAWRPAAARPETRRTFLGAYASRQSFGWILALLALILPWLPFADRNLIDKATLLLIYVMLGWGLNVVVGLAGLLDLGYVAFYAVGAYSYALLSQNFGLSFWVCLPLAGLLAAVFGMLLGFPVLRLRGDYLAIVTLGFGEIVRVILLNWQDVTGGPNGVSGIQRPSFFGHPFTATTPTGTTFHDLFGLPFSPDHRIIFLYYLSLTLALATNLVTLRIRRLPIGRAWEALREDEIACRSLGIDPTRTKLSAFATGAMFAGFAGSFFATRQGFISPESFSFLESAIILAIVVLGGLGSQIGIVLSAILLVGLPEWFRDLQQYRMLAFGGAMVLIMLWRPRGLMASRDPTVRLAAVPTSPGTGG
ncbi:MAG: high-affinity branched-chain amino acid ABC transporter permease LivM [Telmatospirillum sp.]|nr:high-affinity branched-chain amino acid ABC transporter permease LivM [Telmatospirillum sp.]